MRASTKTRKMVVVALLAAIATVLMYIEFPLPLMPPFLKLDVSATPVLIGSFMFGPVSGVAVAAIKALVHLLSTQTAGVGELADFLMTSAMAITAGLIYRRYPSKKGALAASISCVGSLIVVGALANYFILLPFYAKAYMMPLETIIELCNKVNPAITSMWTYILFGVVPFNLVKGVVVATVTFLLYKRISGVVHSYTEHGTNKAAHRP